MKSIIEKLVNYVSKATNSVEINETTDLFGEGVVHSLFAMQMILFIEKEFDVELDDEELDFDTIKTIKDIAELVSKRQGEE